MAQNSSNFSTWSSSPDANLCYKFDDCTNMRDSAMETDMDQSAWLQIERVTAQHCPTQIQFQRPDVLGSVERRYDSGQGRKVDSGFNERIENLANKYPVDSSVINRLPNRTRSHGEESFQEEGENQVVEAPPRKIKTGRRRRVSDGSPDGWVASKNLISERKRREKLQKGLITLRELVPMFTMKMDKVSILVDAINYMKELKQTLETLEAEDVDPKAMQASRSSCNNLETSDGEYEGDHSLQRRNSSTDGSFCSEVSDEMMRCDYETSPSSRNCDVHQMQLNVCKLDHGLYKLNVVCGQQSDVLVHLSQAIESFVIEVVHTSIAVITSAKVTCTFIVKMSSWNDMTMGDVTADVKNMLGKSGLHFPEVP